MSYTPLTPTGLQRSWTLPPLPFPLPPSAGSALFALCGEAGKPTSTNDLETYTHTDTRRRGTLRSLSAAYSGFNSSMVGFALKYREIRRGYPPVVAFVDAARDFDQELLRMRFVLDGPDYVAYLPASESARADAALRRATEALARGGCKVRRCEDLWAAHYACESTGKMVWHQELNASVDSGKLDAELACHRFWQRAKKSLQPLVWSLKKEAKRMKGIVSSLEQNRELPFLRELRQKKKKSKKVRSPPPPTPPLPVESANTSTDTLSSSDPPNRMRRALPVAVAARKKPTTTRLSKLSLRQLRLKTRNPLGIDPAYLALRTRYQVLKARDKMRGGKDPTASRAMWLAFREALRKHPGPPSYDVIKLGIKTDTRILLMTRQMGNFAEPATS